MSDKRFDNKNLKAAIDKSGMTREQIAAKVGCDTSSITKYYNGDRYPKTDIIIKLSELFNISTDYLLGVTKIETSLKTNDNTALRISCDYTGLNPSAIENLRNPAIKYPFYQFNADEKYKEIKNNLLSNKNLFYIINDLVFLYNQFTETQNELTELEEELNCINNLEDCREKARKAAGNLRTAKADLYDNEKKLSNLFEDLQGFNYDDISKSYNKVIEILKILNNKQYGIEYDEQ